MDKSNLCSFVTRKQYHDQYPDIWHDKFGGGGGGGGGKALTMTMTPWNLPHGQWSKKLTMTMTPSILPMVNGQIDKF